MAWVGVGEEREAWHFELQQPKHERTVRSPTANRPQFSCRPTAILAGALRWFSATAPFAR
eukprot:CAMPEP_0171948750 /NCGR_PEP_ID=MMETSP0993-20121228/69068_1 /TAXON_ID=483369 /ORGANISM="non described non described, Strain CCMP2098" /LENGTH=59 /DNA_ID=CAMNT_0012592959 /DNA_START=90 /DNA_END=266 /DNA_ORIENTATION=+